MAGFHRRFEGLMLIEAQVWVLQLYSDVFLYVSLRLDVAFGVDVTTHAD